MIARALELPSKLVMDADLSPNVSALQAFVTVGRLTSRDLGVEYRYLGDQEQEIVTTSRITTTSVNAYGQNAFLLIERLASTLNISEIAQGFKAIGASTLTVSPIRNLPTVLSGGKEQRAQIDIDIMHIHRVGADVWRAKTVEISTNKG
jgi:hypothetical protein